MSFWKRKIATFMISQTISLLGSSLVMYAIMWHVTLSTQSGSMMLIMVLTTFIPSLLLTPFAGVWADRINRRFLIIAADLLIALVTLLVAILLIFNIRDLWILFIVSVIRAIGQAIHQPAVSAVYPQIVPKDKLIKVQGIAQGIQSASFVAMPLLAGLLLTMFPIEYILFIDVITAFIAVTILLIFVKLPRHIGEVNDTKIHYFADMKDGIRYAKSHPFVFSVLTFSFLFMIMVAAPSFLSYLQVARVFGDEPWRLSLLEAFFGAGMLIGSILISFWGGFKNRLITFFFAYIFIGVGTILLGIPFNYYFYISMWSMVGFFIAISNPVIVGLIQEKVDPAYIGRVFSVFSLINTVSMPLGMIVFGPLADVINVSHIILVAGIMMGIIAIVPLFNKRLLKEGKKTPKVSEEELSKIS